MKQERTENDNCLAGMKCPECGSLEPFEIHSQSMCTIYDSGTTRHRDIEWEDDAVCVCVGCKYLGTVARFKRPPDPIRLPCYGIVIQLDGKGGGTIDSELHVAGDDVSTGYILDGVESTVLAHACAGIDILTPAYVQGIETAVDKAYNMG